MADNSPTPSDGKRTLIAPVILGGTVIALLFGMLLFPGRNPAPSPSVVEPPAPAAPAPKPTIPATVQPLDRQQILEAVAAQTAAHSAGERTSTKDALIGRRFSLRIPFGCDGPQTSAGAAQAYFEYDATKRTAKLVARPGDWKSLPMIPPGTESAAVEDVEGFWLPRSWSYSDACPVRRDAPVPATPTPVAAPSVGLAQVFSAEGSRALRRDGRPYEFVRKADASTAPLTATFRLVLEGRIAGFDDGQAVSCWSESPDHRPICVVGVTFDRVAFEDTAGQSIAEWKE